MNLETLVSDLLSLRVQKAAAEIAAQAIWAAMEAGPKPAPILVPVDTLRALGVPEEEPMQTLTALYDRAAHALEWGAEHSNPRFGDLGLLPTNYFTQDALPDEVQKKHFVWKRVSTKGTGNGGFFVAARPKTPSAKAVFRWVKSQVNIPFYGGYWWELLSRFTVDEANEIADNILRCRDEGLPFPKSCADAELIDERLRFLSGPRMWALVGAVAPGQTWTARNMREYRKRREAIARRKLVRKLTSDAAAAGCGFVPAE